MNPRMLYADSLVRLTDEAIVLENYYLFTSRTIPLTSIDRIEVYPATLLTGAFRLFGSGNLRTWFPLDWQRPQRDRIFIMRLKECWYSVGFTVEDGAMFEQILWKLRLLGGQQ